MEVAVSIEDFREELCRVITGEKDASEVERLAEQAGLSSGQLETARQRLQHARSLRQWNTSRDVRELFSMHDPELVVESESIKGQLVSIENAIELCERKVRNAKRFKDRRGNVEFLSREQMQTHLEALQSGLAARDAGDQGPKVQPQERSVLSSFRRSLETYDKSTAELKTLQERFIQLQDRQKELGLILNNWQTILLF